MKHLKVCFTLIVIFIFLSPLSAQYDYIQSEKLVDNKGELLNTEDYFLKNEIDNDTEIIKKFYFDKKGRLLFQRNYDFEDNLMYDFDGVAIYEFKYDSVNNVIETRFFDEEKNFFPIDNSRAAIIKRQFDDSRRITKLEFFLDENTPIDYGSAMITFEYADEGKTITQSHYNGEGQMIDHSAPIITLNYDDEGRIIKKTYKDENGEICNRFMGDDEEDVASIEYEYYGGQLKIQRAYNLKGELINTVGI